MNKICTVRCHVLSLNKVTLLQHTTSCQRIFTCFPLQPYRSEAYFFVSWTLEWNWWLRHKRKCYTTRGLKWNGRNATTWKYISCFPTNKSFFILLAQPRLVKTAQDLIFSACTNHNRKIGSRDSSVHARTVLLTIFLNFIGHSPPESKVGKRYCRGW
jgi:hypothetical protein